MTDKKINGSIYKFISSSRDRLDLEIIVLDKDKKSAINFIKKHNINIAEHDCLKYCTEWLRYIKKGEEEKLKIHFSGSGPKISV